MPNHCQENKKSVMVDLRITKEQQTRLWEMFDLGRATNPTTAQEDELDETIKAVVKPRPEPSIFVVLPKHDWEHILAALAASGGCTHCIAIASHIRIATNQTKSFDR